MMLLVCTLDFVFFLINGLYKGNLLLCGSHETSAIYFTPSLKKKKLFIMVALRCKIETLLCVFP